MFDRGYEGGSWGASNVLSLGLSIGYMGGFILSKIIKLTLFHLHVTQKVYTKVLKVLAILEKNHISLLTFKGYMENQLNK